MNIFRKEFRDTLRSLIVWSLSSALFIFVAMMKFRGFQGNNAEVTELMNSFPESVKAAFGIGALDLTSMPGYYSVMFIYFIMIAAIHAAMLGGHILAKEEIEKTSEFLLPKPVSRSRLVSFKLLSGLATVILFNLFLLVTTILFVNLYNEGASISREIVFLNGLMLILQVLFFLLGTALSAVTKNNKQSGALATAVILASYFLSVMIEIKPSLDKIAFLSPFTYFDAKRIFLGTGYELIPFLLSFGLIGLFVFATYFFYRRKDIPL